MTFLSGNRNNIGMDTAGVIQLWNEEQPDAPVLPDGGVDASS